MVGRIGDGPPPSGPSGGSASTPQQQVQAAQKTFDAAIANGQDPVAAANALLAAVSAAIPTPNSGQAGDIMYLQQVAAEMKLNPKSPMIKQWAGDMDNALTDLEKSSQSSKKKLY